MSTIDRLKILGFAVVSTAPLSLATLHQDPLVTAATALSASMIAVTVYALVRSHWDYTGLYYYVNSVSRTLGLIQLYSWLISYFLYVVYTVDYIDYYVLNIPDPIANALTIALPIAFSIMVLTETSYWFILGLALSQVVLSLPIPTLGWAFSVSRTVPAPQTVFLNVLSSSLLIVCITLTPYIRGDSRYARYVVYAFALSSALMVMGSFFKPSQLVVELTSISDAGLILAEYTALYNLLYHGLGINRVRAIVPALVIALAIISLINYSGFYLITIYPSVADLYLTLFIVMVASIGYLRGWYVVPSIIASGLMLYGEYTVISEAHGLYLYEVIAALVIPIVIGLVFRRVRGGVLREVSG